MGRTKQRKGRISAVNKTELCSTISLEKAVKMLDKNSRTMTKVLELQGVLESMKNTDAVSQHGRLIEIRIERLKSRISRRLVKLARWVDVPPVKRLPEPILGARPATRLPAHQPRPSQSATQPRNIFIPDLNVQRGAGIVPVPTQNAAGRAGFPYSLSVPKKPDDAFQPGRDSLFKAADEIIMQQKKVLYDALHNKSTPPSMSTNSTECVSGPDNAITVSLPTKRTTN